MSLMLLAASAAMYLALGLPSMIGKVKEYKRQKNIKNLLSMEGHSDNSKIEGLQKVYLPADSFEKYFGNQESAKGYVRENVKVHAKNFEKFGETSCPILKYMHDSEIRINNSLGGILNAAALDNFTLDRIKAGAKVVSANSNASLENSLIDANVSENANSLISKYIEEGIIERRCKNPALDHHAAANPHIYLINPNAGLEKIDGKRYAVDDGSIRWLGDLNKSYSEFDSENLAIMPLLENESIKISDDKKFKDILLGKVLMNAKSVFIKDGDGTLENIALDGSWQNTLSPLMGKKVMLSPTQSINYELLCEKDDAEKEKQ